MEGERWPGMVPHVERDPRHNEDGRFTGSTRVTGVANFAMAGWRDFPPLHSHLVEQADAAAWDPGARLCHLDKFGIYAQLLYPNLLGFRGRPEVIQRLRAGAFQTRRCSSYGGGRG